jgi:hypothetical protein
MLNAKIIAASKLIADFDASLSRLFLDQPFSRHTIATALHETMMRSGYPEDLSDRVSVFIRSAIDSTMPAAESV